MRQVEEAEGESSRSRHYSYIVSIVQWPTSDGWLVSPARLWHGRAGWYHEMRAESCVWVEKSAWGSSKSSWGILVVQRPTCDGWRVYPLTQRRGRAETLDSTKLLFSKTSMKNEFPKQFYISQCQKYSHVSTRMVISSNGPVLRSPQPFSYLWFLPEQNRVFFFILSRIHRSDGQPLKPAYNRFLW